MIASSTELKVALRNLALMEQALRALRQQLEVANPQLLDVTAKAYEKRIASLQTELARYLYDHPSEVSSLLPPLDVAEVAA